jgi:hypothetical protein
MAKSTHVTHVNRLIKSDTKFKALVKQYGKPRATKDCTELSKGDICMVTDCVDGKRIVMRCDGSGGCTDYSEESCTSSATAAAAKLAKRTAAKKRARG